MDVHLSHNQDLGTGEFVAIHRCGPPVILCLVLMSELEIPAIDVSFSLSRGTL